MTRCAPQALALAAGLLAAALPACARNFPATALRGQIAFGEAPPAIVLNGQAALLSPGARIHGQDGMLKMTGAVVDQAYVVDYTLESTGLVSEVWLLTNAEAAVRPWPTTPQQQQAWSFDPIAQTWTTP